MGKCVLYTIINTFLIYKNNFSLYSFNVNLVKIRNTKSTVPWVSVFCSFSGQKRTSAEMDHSFIYQPFLGTCYHQSMILAINLKKLVFTSTHKIRIKKKYIKYTIHMIYVCIYDFSQQSYGLKSNKHTILLIAGNHVTCIYYNIFFIYGI